MVLISSHPTTNPPAEENETSPLSVKRSYALYSLALGILLFLLSAFSPAEAAVPPPPAPPVYSQADVLEVLPLPATTPKQVDRREMVKLRITSGDDAGQEVTSIYTHSPMKEVVTIQFQPGDHVIVSSTSIAGQKQYAIADYQRLPWVYALLALFAITLFLIGGKGGFKSLVVIVFPLVVIFWFMLPLILSGRWHIIPIVLVLSLLTASVTQVIISGWNAKTVGAFLGAIGGVAAAAILSWASIYCMHLSGLESEESIMLRAVYLPDMNFQDVLFAGLILGALGTVMDTAISVASSQYEVKSARPDISCKDLFLSGVRIGRDIMGTCSNTLILAYLGSFFPLILLIAVQQNTPLPVIMNSAPIVTEIVRSITGCIGLICTIPISSFTTAFCLTRKKHKKAA